MYQYEWSGRELAKHYWWHVNEYGGTHMSGVLSATYRIPKLHPLLEGFENLKARVGSVIKSDPQWPASPHIDEGIWGEHAREKWQWMVQYLAAEPITFCNEANHYMPHPVKGGEADIRHYGLYDANTGLLVPQAS